MFLISDAKLLQVFELTKYLMLKKLKQIVKKCRGISPPDTYTLI